MSRCVIAGTEIVDAAFGAWGVASLGLSLVAVVVLKESFGRL